MQNVEPQCTGEMHGVQLGGTARPPQQLGVMKCTVRPRSARHSHGMFSEIVRYDTVLGLHSAGGTYNPSPRAKQTVAEPVKRSTYACWTGMNVLLAGKVIRSQSKL